MRGSIFALVAVTLAAAIIEVMMPGEENSGTRYFLRFLTALFVLMILLRPFLSLLGMGDDFLRGELEWTQSEHVESDFKAQFEQAIANRSAIQLKERLAVYLQNEFGLSQTSFELGVVLDASGELEQISVRLVGAGLLRDPAEIEAALMDLFDCTVEVR